MSRSFHRRTGSMVTLSNTNKTAQRNHPLQEFNNGLVMSNDPLIDDQLFEVKIERKVPTWSGSIEIGVTSLDPSVLDFPSSATNLRENSWVMSGTSILENGISHLEGYGDDLDALSEGDRVGVMRTSSGELHFYVNGVDQGTAASRVTGTIYAVIDLYGKCTQVSLVDASSKRSISISVEDLLHFHEHCGTMVRLTNGNRTAERKEPVDEFNNGVVMTYRPLKDDELFEIRIDKLVNKWSGSIEMGITTHNPDTLDFPATMTNMRSGTIMMSGCGILTNGKGSRREYGEYNLDELYEGDRIGLIRKSNKNLHYYINGLDQGMAAENVPTVVFGVVDLYGMTVKVSITDYLRPTVNEPVSQSNSSSLEIPQKVAGPRILEDELLFHEHCGVHVSVCNGGLTAVRPNCLDDFNNAVVITNRPLCPGELFEVLLEQVVMKWAGSIEIGVTTHSAMELEFPSTMTNVRSGTWMMTGNGIMYNGSTIADEYGRNLDKLKAGDKVGVIVYEDGRLHFFVNGVDQGLAACNVPDGVYGVIDLYGQAAKASIVRNSSTPTLYEDANASAADFDSDQCMSRASSMAMDIRNMQIGKIEAEHINEVSRPRASHNDPHSLYFDNDDFLEPLSNDIIFEPEHSFHPIYGSSITLDPCNVTATRIGDYCHGIVFSAKPLENDDMFEVQIFTINSSWGGSLMFGVTTYTPDSPAVLPATAIELTGCDVWLLVECQLYKNGHVVKRNYAPYFPRITAGDKVGVKVFNDNSLHFFLNGVDLGTAATHMPKKLRVIADVFGAVESIKICDITHPLMKKSTSKNIENTKNVENLSTNIMTYSYSENSVLTFHEKHGRNIQLTNDNLSACRVASYNQGVVMSCRPLQPDELFQIRIDTLHSNWSGSIQLGVSSQNPDLVCLPITALSMRRSTWIVCGESVFYNGIKVRSKYGPNLDSLKSSQIIGVKIDQNKCLHLFVNGIDQGIAAEEIEHPAFAIVDIYGQCCQVTITNDDYSSDNEPEKDDKEKADIENNGVKEKILKPGCSRPIPPRNCEHQNLCEKIKMMLALPESLFVPDNIKCFCETCHKLRGDVPYFKKGDPPKEFAQPFGWCRFPLKTSLKAEKSGIHEKWHVAFQGISFGAVRQILDKGKLLPPEMLGFKVQSKKPSKGGTSKETDSCHVLISPTMRYAGSPKFCPKEEYLDPSTNKMYQGRVAFQVYVRPGSYTVGPQQLGIRDLVDIQFSNNDLEWYTKEEGSIVLQGLLIRIDCL